MSTSLQGPVWTNGLSGQLSWCQLVPPPKWPLARTLQCMHALMPAANAMLKRCLAVPLSADIWTWTLMLPTCSVGSSPFSSCLMYCLLPRLSHPVPHPHRTPSQLLLFSPAQYPCSGVSSVAAFAACLFLVFLELAWCRLFPCFSPDPTRSSRNLMSAPVHDQLHSLSPLNLQNRSLDRAPSCYFFKFRARVLMTHLIF